MFLLDTFQFIKTDFYQTTSVFHSLKAIFYQIKSRFDLFQAVSGDVDTASGRVNILNLPVNRELLHAAVERFGQLEIKANISCYLWFYHKKSIFISSWYYYTFTKKISKRFYKILQVICISVTSLSCSCKKKIMP